MKLKLALIAALGLLLGALAGGYFGFATAQQFTGTLLTSQVEGRFVDKVLLLKLIDDGKIEEARASLLNSIQSDTILAGIGFSIAAQGPSAADARSTLLRFARMSGNLKSVREDESALGREAAAARARLPPADKR